MKGLLIVFICLLTITTAKAQFPGTDSLRNYNNRHITNNPATAFTNLRLNTLLRGIIDWIDTARAGTGGGGALGIDTIFAVNDSTIRYRKNGVFRNFVLKGVYDLRHKVDTIYKVNDTTVGFTINQQARTITIPGRGTFVDSIYRKEGQDSIFYRIAGVEHAIKDSSGIIITNATATGDTLLTADNTIKRLDHDATLVFSTNASKILMGADTISYVSTPWKLKDTARVLRELIAAVDPGITELTGDVTAGPGSGSQVATIADNAITNPKLAQAPAFSVKGNAFNTTDNVGDILALNDHSVLRRNGTTINFGAINLASPSAVTGVLGYDNLDTSSVNSLVTQSDLNNLAVPKLADSTGSKIQAIDDSTFVLNTGVGGIYDSTIYAYPGDTLQRKLELVPEHGRLVIMPGLHELPLCEMNSIMYVDRSNLTIEFAAGSHVKVADFSNEIIDSVEINRNYGNIVGLDDISAQCTVHPPIPNQSIQIQITSTGSPNQFTVSGASSGNGVYSMDGTFQAIGSTGIEVKFAATTGHTLNDLWWLITSSTPASVLRIGEGFHTDTIRNINIIGSGILDGNAQNQDTVNGRAHESNYTLGIFGRVHNVTIRDISIINSERSIMAAGRHSGTFNQNGSTTGGESFDVSNLKILNVSSYENTAGFLFGHPAYRGYAKNILVDGCSIINNTSLATVEPNHRCDSFVLTNNYIENQTGGSSLHLWRAPSNGKIFNNIIRGTTGDNAPTGWYRSFGLNNWADYDNNLFSLSQQNAINSTNNANRIGLGTTSPTTKLQVVGPHVSGQGLVNIKGSSTVGFVVLNTTTAPGTTGLSLQSGGGAVGSFQGSGSDTTIKILNDRYAAQILTLYNNGSVNFGVPSTKPTVRFQFRDTVTFSSVVPGAIRTIERYEYKWTSNTPNPFAGHGMGFDYDISNASAVNKNVAKIEIPYTDGVSGSEDVDYVIKLIRAGTVTEAFRVLSTGALKINNAYTLPASDGANGQAIVANGSGSATFQTLMLKGSTTWDPANIAGNSSTTTTVSVTGAALGDPVTISKVSGSYSNGEIYFAYVSAPNTVTIQLQNASGGSFDITEATYNVIVLKY